MPRLSRGGKWVYGWATVCPDQTICVPQEAWDEYGFTPGTEALLLRGSATSGGLILGRADRVPPALMGRVIARSVFGCGNTVPVPGPAGHGLPTRLLAVRGSGHALGLLAKGPVYARAVQDPGLGDRLDTLATPR